MKNKKLISTSVFLFTCLLVFGQDPASEVESIYSTYVRPFLIALVVVFFAAGGIGNFGKIRKGGEAAVEGWMATGQLALYPVIVFVVAEILNSIIT